MRKLTADTIYPVSSGPLKNSVIITGNNGEILAVEPVEQHDPASIEHIRGVIVPGFVNTHCHLELSHMKGKVDTGTGLIPFITNVVTKRNAPQEIIADAIEKAEQEMLEGGIVALGDISNTTDTFAVKSRGRMRYYTFVEMFDFLQDAGAQKAFADWSAVFDQIILAEGSARTIVPHAPYSVSRELFRMINDANPASGVTISIHNQETPPEQELFLNKKGGFIDFYSKFGISLDAFEPNGKPSIHYALANMSPARRTLFVHNTLTTRDDVTAAQAWSANTYWATCPNANLYIENRLPDYQAFIDTGARVTIGTDSLTSNWQLSILEEMKTISMFQSYVTFETMLRWATLNGAEALGFEQQLGSIEPGKIPGLVQIEGMHDGRLQPQSKVKRII
jgi:cytosine/adenosine deaminase-related metal-dependent hydrolase